METVDVRGCEGERKQEAEKGNDEAILAPLDGVFAPPPIC